MILSGCVAYLDNPESQTVSGIVIDGETKQPTTATVQVFTKRKFICFPGMSYPTSGKIFTNPDGTFSLELKDQWPIEIQAHKEMKSGKTIVELEGKDQIEIILVDLSNEENWSNQQVDPIVKTPVD